MELELDRLQAEGSLTPVRFLDWAAPIVLVVKANGQIRISGDYKMTINQVAQPDVYPLPLVEDLFTLLSCGKIFSKLDLMHIYQQVLLEEESKKFTTINTTLPVREASFQDRSSTLHFSVPDGKPASRSPTSSTLHQ